MAVFSVRDVEHLFMYDGFNGASSSPKSDRQKLADGNNPINSTSGSHSMMSAAQETSLQSVDENRPSLDASKQGSASRKRASFRLFGRRTSDGPRQSERSGSGDESGGSGVDTRKASDGDAAEAEEKSGSLTVDNKLR